MIIQHRRLIIYSVGNDHVAMVLYIYSTKYSRDKEFMVGDSEFSCKCYDARTIKDKEFLIQCESFSMTTPQQGDLAMKVLSLYND